MSSYLIYGKRTGKPVDGEPIYDKTFRALDYFGKRVTKLEQAGTYAERADAEDVVERRCRELIDKGLIEIEIRKAK